MLQSCVSSLMSAVHEFTWRSMAAHLNAKFADTKRFETYHSVFAPVLALVAVSLRPSLLSVFLSLSLFFFPRSRTLPFCLAG